MDGTIIDSAPSILKGLQKSAQKRKYQLIQPLTTNLIGPPLKQTFQVLTGENSNDKLDILMADFKDYYDNQGIESTKAYPGIIELLKKLKADNFELMIATNKRLIPTLKIIKLLKLTSFFSEIYSIDKSPENFFASKFEMLGSLINKSKLIASNSFYIGDRIEDQEASERNGLNSITATWGYGDYRDLSYYSKVVHSPLELCSIFKKTP
jgi:phosphoglycolate phosphatase